MWLDITDISLILLCVLIIHNWDQSGTLDVLNKILNFYHESVRQPVHTQHMHASIAGVSSPQPGAQLKTYTFHWLRGSTSLQTASTNRSHRRLGTWQVIHSSNIYSTEQISLSSPTTKRRGEKCWWPPIHQSYLPVRYMRTRLNELFTVHYIHLHLIKGKYLILIRLGYRLSIHVHFIMYLQVS